MRVATIVIAASFALAGCSASTTSDAGLPTSIAPSPSPAANILDNAIESTVSRGTALISISIDSTDSQVSGSGSTSLANNRGEINWRDPSTNESWTDLINSDGTYTLVEQSWFLAPAGTQTPTSGNISPLSQIWSMVKTGENSLEGSVALTIDSGMNFSDEELTELGKSCDMTLDVEVGLNADGLISSIVKLFVCEGNEKVSVSELSDFGSPINLSTPEDAFEVDPNQ